MNKKEIKKKMMEILSNERILTNPRRIETICRARINRLSYEFNLGDHCIYLERDGKQIFIESRCHEHKYDGYGRPAYITAYNESVKILEKLEAWHEEAIRADQQSA
jgi:hypothetical protein